MTLLAYDIMSWSFSFFNCRNLGRGSVTCIAVQSDCTRTDMDVMNLASMAVNTVFTAIDVWFEFLWFYMTELALDGFHSGRLNPWGRGCRGHCL